MTSKLRKSRFIGGENSGEFAAPFLAAHHCVLVTVMTIQRQFLEHVKPSCWIQSSRIAESRLPLSKISGRFLAALVRVIILPNLQPINMPPT
jgi:hypothetical protein